MKRNLSYSKKQVTTSSQSYLAAALNRLDPLTRALNHTAFQSYLSNQVAEAAVRHKALALVVVDLDGFCQVNRSYGLPFGDEILRQFVERLQKSLPQEAWVGRLGDDEFAVLLPGANDHPSISGWLKDTVWKVLAETYGDPGRQVEIAASVGVAVFPHHSLNSDGLLAAADAALRRSKKQKGLAIYSAKIDGKVAKPFLAQDLRRAMSNHELCLFYQPQVALAAHKLVGFEALLRWRHPQEGLLLPGRFLSSTEQPGICQELSHWVLREVMEQTKEWYQRGFRGRVGQNLSPLALRDTALPGLVGEALRVYSIDPKKIELEVIEDAVMHNLDQATELLGQISALGVRIALDDFGTGYSSLSRLSEIPADSIKLDKGLVNRVESDADQMSIVKAAIMMGHSLGLEVIAEGIESQASLDTLTSLECDGGQGYHIARPMEASKVIDWIEVSGWISADI